MGGLADRAWPPRYRRLATLVVALWAVGLYANSLQNDLVWDDTYVVAANPSIQSLSNVPGFFTQAWGAGTTVERGKSKNAGFYRPLALASIALDYAIWGLEPLGFHLSNVLIHALLVLLVFSLARRLTADDRVAALAALLYAAHATHAEAVDVIAYRTSLLAVGFVLLGLRVHLATSVRARDPRRWLVVPLCLAAGVASKETAIVLPGLVVAVDFLLPAGRKRPTVAAAAVTYLPLLLVAGGYLLLRRSLLASVPITFFAGMGPEVVVLTMAKVFALYVRLLLLPYPLCPFYDWSLVPPATSLADAEVIGGLLAVAGYLAALVWTYRRHRTACFLLALYGIALLPFSHIMPFVVPAADRFLLLPSAAFAIGLVWGAAALARRPGTQAWLWWGVVAVLILGNAALTIRRNTHWKTQETILAQTALDHPESFNARMRYGEHLLAEGALQRAEDELRAAMRLMPALEAPVARLVELLLADGREREAREIVGDFETRHGPTPTLRERLDASLRR